WASAQRWRQPRATPFPYTTLFRSTRIPRSRWQHGRGREPVVKDVAAVADKLAAARAAALRPLAVREGEAALAAPASSIPVSWVRDRKSTRLNSSHGSISYAVFCLK